MSYVEFPSLRAHGIVLTSWQFSALTMTGSGNCSDYRLSPFGYNVQVPNANMATSSSLRTREDVSPTVASTMQDE